MALWNVLEFNLIKKTFFIGYFILSYLENLSTGHLKFKYGGGNN
jgi:hypothetical protein